MKMIKVLPAAILMVTLGASGMTYAQEEGGSAHKEKSGKEWSHHHCGGLFELLPENKIKLLHETMKKVHEENKPLHEQKRKLHEELDALLKAPQFDQDAYLKKSAELDALHDQMKKNKETAFASMAAKFTPEERKVLVAIHHMKRHHHHHGGKWHHHEKGMHPHDHNGTSTHHDGEQTDQPTTN